MLEIFAVALILFFAAVIIAVYFYRLFTGKTTGCGGCSCKFNQETAGGQGQVGPQGPDPCRGCPGQEEPGGRRGDNTRG